MRLTAVLRTGILIAEVFLAATVVRAQKPDASTDAQTKEAQAKEALGMPPRTAATEYLTHTQIGPISIGAEFVGHSIPTPQANYSSEDYVIVEIGMFGPPDARVRMSVDDFSLRINGKKTPLTSKHYELAFHS